LPQLSGFPLNRSNYTTSCAPCQMVPSAATYSYVQGRCPISAPQLKGNREILMWLVSLMPTVRNVPLPVR